MGRTCSTYGGIQKLIQNLVGNPEGKRSLGRRSRRREDNITMDFREVGCDRDWITLAEDRDQWRAYIKAVMKLRVP